MYFKISGNIITPSEIRIFNSAWTCVKYKFFGVGAWELDELPNEGPYYVIAIPHRFDENISGYKNVMAVPYDSD